MLVALEEDRTALWCAAAAALGGGGDGALRGGGVSGGGGVLCGGRAALAAGGAARGALGGADGALARAQRGREWRADESPVFLYHAIRWREIERAGVVTNTWYDPVGIALGHLPATAWAGVAITAGLFTWGIWRGGRLARIASVFAVCYVAFVLFVIAFLDAATPLDVRILSPVFVAALWTGGSLLAWALDGGTDARRRLAPWATALASALLLAHGYVGARVVERLHGGKYRATITSWRTAPLTIALRALPAGTPVWTNAALQLRLLTSVDPRELPRPVNVSTLRPNPDYATAVAAVPSGAYVAQYGDSITLPQCRHARSRPHTRPRDDDGWYRGRALSREVMRVTCRAQAQTHRGDWSRAEIGELRSGDPPIMSILSTSVG